MLFSAREHLASHWLDLAEGRLRLDRLNRNGGGKTFFPWASPIPREARKSHPADVKVESPIRSQPWILVTSVDHTAHAGPWGISFSANLTPDNETGLGTWTEEQFIKTLREGKVRGRGRSLLPPMPWPHFTYLEDEDLKSIFAYLRTVKAVKNRVPEPTAPAGR